MLNVELYTAMKKFIMLFFLLLHLSVSAQSKRDKIDIGQNWKFIKNLSDNLPAQKKLYGLYLVKTWVANTNKITKVIVK